MSTIDFSTWTQVTGELPAGVQRAFHDALSAVADGQIRMAYQADYSEGAPCLVNSVGQMLTTSGGHGIPSTHFGAVVSEFDRLNGALFWERVNPENSKVSPLAAEILLRHFGELKPLEVTPITEAVADTPYIEPTDKELEEALANLGDIEAPLPVEEVRDASVESVRHGVTD